MFMIEVPKGGDKKNIRSEKIPSTGEGIKGQEVLQHLSEVLGRIQENKGKITPLISELAYIKARMRNLRGVIDDKWLFKGRAADEYHRLVGEGRNVLREQRDENYTEAVSKLREDKALLENLLTHAGKHYPHIGLVLSNSAPPLVEPYDMNQRAVAFVSGELANAAPALDAKELERRYSDMSYHYGYANRPQYSSQSDWDKFNRASTAFLETGYSTRTMRFPWDSIPKAGDKVAPKELAESVVGDI